MFDISTMSKSPVAQKKLERDSAEHMFVCKKKGVLLMIELKEKFEVCTKKCQNYMKSFPGYMPWAAPNGI